MSKQVEAKVVTPEEAMGEGLETLLTINKNVNAIRRWVELFGILAILGLALGGCTVLLGLGSL